MKFAHIILILAAAMLLLAGCTTTGKNSGGNEVKNQTSAPSAPKQEYVVDLGPEFDNSGSAAKNNGGTAAKDNSGTSGKDNVAAVGENSAGAPKNETAPEAPAAGTAAPNVPEMKNTSACTISFDKDSIFVGESVDVALTATPGYMERATFSCGKDIKSIGTNGVFRRSYLCQYDSPEDVEVWVRINEKVCASKTLHVLSKVEKMPVRGCALDNASIVANMAEGHFAANVTYANYSTADKLTWDCGGRIFYRTLGASNVFTNSPRAEGMLTVTCDYVGATAKENIPQKITVKINDDLCGEFKTH